MPFDATVTVKLDDEAGAAGLIFRHDGERHYGFYPTGGKLRLTRFDGPNVYSWHILKDLPSPAYKPGEWNTIRVRVAKDGVKCFVNGQLVVESDDAEWADGQVGLAKFRQTKAEFKNFRVGSDLTPKPTDVEGRPQTARRQAGPGPGRQAGEGEGEHRRPAGPGRGAGEAGRQAQGAGRQGPRAAGVRRAAKGAERARRRRST